jgi:hypothetical protein
MKPADGQQDHALDGSRYGWMGMRTAAMAAVAVEADDYYQTRTGGFGRRG